MKTKGDSQAFLATPARNSLGVEYIGLTKREYFAALAMQASVAANDHHNPEWHDKAKSELHAKGAVMLADALIAELNKNQEG